MDPTRRVTRAGARLIGKTLAVMNKSGLVLLGVAFCGAIAVSVFTSLGLGLSFLILFVGWPLLGTRDNR